MGKAPMGVITVIEPLKTSARAGSGAPSTVTGIKRRIEPTRRSR
jgi:hypothetical protein